MKDSQSITQKELLNAVEVYLLENEISPNEYAFLRKFIQCVFEDKPLTD